MFVILHTSTDVLWKECYNCIRRLYVDIPITIISSDHLDISECTNTTLYHTFNINHLTPLIYLMTEDVTYENAVILYDTMMIRDEIDMTTNRMLFSCTPPLDLVLEVLTLTGRDTHRCSTSSYKGCYVLSKDLISKIDDDIFGLTFYIKNRDYLQAIDAIVTDHLISLGVSDIPLIGSVDDVHPTYSIGEYVLGIMPSMSIVPIMSTSYMPIHGDDVEIDVDTVIGDSKSLCLVAVYTDRNRPMLMNTILFINELSTLYDRVVVLAAGDRIDVTNMDSKVRLLYLPNKNYDFGLWYRIVRHLPLDKIDELCLCNNSCLITRSISNTVRYMRSIGETFSGITDNYDKGYHIQSYFMVFRGYAAIHRLHSFFLSKDMEREYDYSSTVENFEVALTPYMKDVVDVKCLYPIENIWMLRTIDSKIKREDLSIAQYNSAWMLWDVLLCLGCPFMKIKRFKSIISADFEKVLLSRFTQSPYLETI